MHLVGPNDTMKGHPVVEHEDEHVSRCIMCGDFIDYCQGHGDDAVAAWEEHDFGHHEKCHPMACDEAMQEVMDDEQDWSGK